MGRAVLLVLTNALQAPRQQPAPGAQQNIGFDIKELALAYHHFHKTLGLEVNLASPSGGQCHIDPALLKASEHEEEVQAFLADKCAMQWVKCTDALGQFDLDRFQAIVFVGGPGAMFDFPSSRPLGKVTRYVWRKDGIVAAIGHGVAALLAMVDPTGDGSQDSGSSSGEAGGKAGGGRSSSSSSGSHHDHSQSDGSHSSHSDESCSSDSSCDHGREGGKRKGSSGWLHGRKVTANTVEEDRDLQLEKTLPFSIERKLREAGVQFSKKSKFETHVVVDGRLITAQNRNSTREWLKAISGKLQK